MTSVRNVSIQSVALTAAAFVCGYPCLVIAANLAQRDSYNAASEAMSNLALGRDGWVMTLAFLSLGVGIVMMAALVRRLESRAVVGPVLLLASSVTTFLSAVFQTDADGAPSTLHGTVHIALGLGSFVLVIAAMVACSVTYIRSNRHRRLGIASAVWGLVEVGTIVLTFALPSSLFGVGQRAVLAVAISWLLTTCVVAVRSSALDPAAARAAGATLESAC